MVVALPGGGGGVNARAPSAVEPTSRPYVEARCGAGPYLPVERHRQSWQQTPRTHGKATPGPPPAPRCRVFGADRLEAGNMLGSRAESGKGGMDRASLTH